MRLIGRAVLQEHHFWRQRLRPSPEPTSQPASWQDCPSTEAPLLHSISLRDLQSDKQRKPSPSLQSGPCTIWEPERTEYPFASLNHHPLIPLILSLTSAGEKKGKQQIKRSFLVHLLSETLLSKRRCLMSKHRNGLWIAPQKSVIFCTNGQNSRMMMDLCTLPKR